MTDAASSAFGRERDFALGVEEELLVAERGTLALSHTGVAVLDRLDVPPGSGSAHPDTYAALVELASPVSRTAGDAVRAIAALRARARAAGGTLIGAGIHPDGAFGDVVHVPEPRYDKIHAQLRGLLRRTPTCALHVHVGMPDADTAIRVYNGMREHLPLLQALAANSPFWHGSDSGLATSRAQLFRGYPRADIPPAFAGYEDYLETVEDVVAAGDSPDYTFLWWDLRPHPRLGTVELRAMDAQSALWTVAGLAALVHGLAATLWHDGALRPVPEIARAALLRARPFARELGSDGELEEIERLLDHGGGADRQRGAHASGGMPALLAHLAAETAATYP